MLYAKAGTALVAILSLMIMGWKAAGWYNDSKKLKDALVVVSQEQQKAIDAKADLKTAEAERDAANATVAALKLEATENQIKQKVKTVKQTVVKYVKQNADCDLPDDVAGQLQKLREGGDPVSEAAP